MAQAVLRPDGQLERPATWTSASRCPSSQQMEAAPPHSYRHRVSAVPYQRHKLAETRDTVAERLTPEQRTEGQRRSREWFAAHPRDP